MGHSKSTYIPYIMIMNVWSRNFEDTPSVKNWNQKLNYYMDSDIMAMLQSTGCSCAPNQSTDTLSIKVMAIKDTPRYGPFPDAVVNDVSRPKSKVTYDYYDIPPRCHNSSNEV